MLSNKLRTLRKIRGLTLEEVAERIGTSKQTVQRYENGVIANVPSDKVEALADILNTTPAALMGWQAKEAKEVKRLVPLPRAENILPAKAKSAPPRVDLANEKTPSPDREQERDTGYDAAEEADLCVLARGDSMIGARILDGDLVFIRSQESVGNGEIAAVLIDGVAVLKRVYYDPEKQMMILSCDNPKYEPLVCFGEELSKIEILGKAVAFQSTVR